MEFPTKEKPVSFILTDSKRGTIHLTDSGRFRAVIQPLVIVMAGGKPVVTITDNIIDFDTFEEAVEHLSENADDGHKLQFQE